MYAWFARAFILIAAMVAVGLPNAATAQAKTDSFRAWLSWACDKKPGVVEISVKIQNQSLPPGDYEVTVGPGSWNRKTIFLASGATVKLENDFAVTANGVNRVELRNASTGKRTTFRTTETVSCVQLRGNQAAPTEPKEVRQKDQPQAAKTRLPAAGAGTVAAAEATLNRQAQLGELLIRWSVLVIMLCLVGIGVTVFARLRYGF